MNRQGGDAFIGKVDSATVYLNGQRYRFIGEPVRALIAAAKGRG